MKVATLLLVLSEFTVILKTKGYITATDDFGDFSNIANDIELATELEGILRKHGVDIPNKVDKVLQLIPLVVELIKN